MLVLVSIFFFFGGGGGGGGGGLRCEISSLKKNDYDVTLLTYGRESGSAHT